MWITIKSITSLLMSHGLLLLGNGMISILLGLRSRMEGFSTEITGFVMAGYFVGLLIGAIYAARVVASVGHIRAFAAFASIMSVAVLGHILYVDAVFWFCLRVIAGLCMAGMVMVVESWVNERATNETRGQILSLYMIINYLGAGLGQFMILIGDPAQFQLFVIASMVYSSALVPILLTRASAPAPSSPDRMPFKKLFAISPIGVYGTVCCGMINATLIGMGAVFASEVGLNHTQVSTFMAAVIATLCSALAVIWAIDQSVTTLVIFGAIFGGFSFVILPLVSSQINDLAKRDQLVQISAGLLIAYGIGASIGPVIAGQLMAQIGPVGLFEFIVAVHFSLIIFIVIRIMQRRRNKIGKAPFLPLGSGGVSSKVLYNAALESAKQTESQKTSGSDAEKT
jgi:MFS family permease